MMALEWQLQAACLGMDVEIFFPEQGASAIIAKRVCFGCSVRVECLNYALRNREPFGVWGGNTPRERRALLRSVNR